MFDIIKFYNDFNIKYFDSGKNVSKGWINTLCCFDNCDDTTNHLGFNLEKNYFKCWKCGYHTIYDTIQKLLPNENTKEILKIYNSDIIIQDKITEKINYHNIKIKLPGSKLQDIHRNYLRQRGLSPDFIEEKYKLNGTTCYGKYQYRLIIPIFQNDRLVSYQTRGLIPEQKYINCDPKEEIIPIKDCLYNLDQCNEKFIVITEGVFKTFKLGDNSVCTFGKNVSMKQVQLLLKYDKIFIYFDPDQAGKEGAEKLSNILDSLGKNVYNIDNDIAPDNLSEKQVKEFWENVVNNM